MRTIIHYWELVIEISHFKNLIEEKKILNLFSENTLNTIEIFDKIKNNKSGIQYYGAVGGGKLSYTVSNCDGETTSYDIFHLAIGYGGEKINIKEPSLNSYGRIITKGIRGNLGKSSIQEIIGTDYGHGRYYSKILENL